ncbi:MAG: tRNA guanosine(34) transglycosylase Tgt [Deltaproteobacteria bacterium]|nr:tRNA guanosine(34) transglycosylase Tgt [Deltaproteobacteria bacterium]
MATRCSSFDLLGTAGAARTGVLHLPHGSVPTPAFMPVGTRGTVRGLTPRDLRGLGASMVLANTYHLWVRPGHEDLRALGGLHRFMGWDGPILTDSGGFQVFSLKEHVKVSEDGVRFRSPLDGQHRHLTPELAVEIQETFGVDVAMALDECIEVPATRDRTASSTDRTTRWLHRQLTSRRQPDRTALFGIVQGGLFTDLRVAHAQELASLDLDGYAIGGLSVGEPQETMFEMVEAVTPHLPTDRVRYLMGVGKPLDIYGAVLRGVDLFDCVLPTRVGRHGLVWTWHGRMNMKNARYRLDDRPLDAGCTCEACTGGFSRAYLRHLYVTDELLGKRLLSVHNLHFYQDLMRRLRGAIGAGDEAVSALGAQVAAASEPAPEGA